MERQLKADNFLKAASEQLQPLKDTYIYEVIKNDRLEKTGQLENGYSQWLEKLLSYLAGQCHLEKKQIKVLDFGCGTGELTVLMNVLGYQTVGIDLHENHLALAKILGQENGLAEDIFVLNQVSKLPFPDNSFNIVMLSVVLEHLDNKTLVELLPELNRICCGVIYILVPNKWQTIDDHTGLRFVPWLPRYIAERYIYLRGRRYRYAISDKGTWDVQYRTLGQIRNIFQKFNFNYQPLPEAVIYPPPDLVPPLFTYKNVQAPAWKKPIYNILGLLRKLLLRLNYPAEGLYSYLNLTFYPTNKEFIP